MQQICFQVNKKDGRRTFERVRYLYICGVGVHSYNYEEQIILRSKYYG